MAIEEWAPKHRGVTVAVKKFAGPRGDGMAKGKHGHEKLVKKEKAHRKKVKKQEVKEEGLKKDAKVEEAKGEEAKKVEVKKEEAKEVEDPREQTLGQLRWWGARLEEVPTGLKVRSNRTLRQALSYGDCLRWRRNRTERRMRLQWSEQAGGQGWEQVGGSRARAGEKIKIPTQATAAWMGHPSQEDDYWTKVGATT
jgi:hypothetical protein